MRVEGIGSGRVTRLGLGPDSGPGCVASAPESPVALIRSTILLADDPDCTRDSEFRINGGSFREDRCTNTRGLSLEQTMVMSIKVQRTKPETTCIRRRLRLAQPVRLEMYDLKHGLIHAAHVYPRMRALELVAIQRECASIVTSHETDTTLHNVTWRMTSTQCQSRSPGDYDRAAL